MAGLCRSTSPAGLPYRPLSLLGCTLFPVASRRFKGTFMDRLAAFPSSFTVPHEHTSVSGINCARECGFRSAFSFLLSKTNLFRQTEQDERHPCPCRVRGDQSPPPQGFLSLVQSSDTSTQTSALRGRGETRQRALSWVIMAVCDSPQGCSRDRALEQSNLKNCRRREIP